MIFNSFKFLLFLPLVYLLFRLCPGRFRWAFLLLASLYFYAALKVYYLLAVIVGVGVISFYGGAWLHKAADQRTRLTRMWVAISGNVILLIALKYLPFFAENLNLLFGSSLVAPVLVSIGVSYFVFQGISYLSDVYLGIEEPETHPGYFLLFLSFFPKLLQGPIERARDLVPQLKKPFIFDYDQARSGLVYFAWGLFLKVVIADRLAGYVNAVYDDVTAFAGAPLLLASYGYTFQIYADFAGYTAMAIGVGRLFGIELSPNFNSPYLATSVADFWRRWHMTFSRWILDYIFKPCQLSWRNLGTTGTALALFVTFLISGIWHGAAWTFVVWGVLHGFYMAASVYWKPWQKRLHKSLGVQKTLALKVWQIFVTFHLVAFAWIFFRAGSLSDAWYVVTHLFASPGTGGWFAANPGMQVIADGLVTYDLYVVVAAFVVLALVGKLRSGPLLTTWPGPYRWVTYFLLTLSILWFGVMTNTQFIYFQF